MSSAPRWRRFADREELAAEVATAVEAAVKRGVSRRGHASLVISGGSTPEAFLPGVARLELPWKQVSILLADERRVPEDSVHSNTAMLRRVLLSAPGPSRARFVSLIGSPDLASVRARLPQSDVPYDLVLLGMGSDGHFASLFPGSPRLAELLAPDNAERVATVPAPTTAKPAVERITMTLAELTRADRVVLVIQGQEKRAVLEEALAHGDRIATPVVALGGIEVFWGP